MEKKDLLKEPVKHIDIKSFDSSDIIEAMKDMSFSARDTAKAAEIKMRSASSGLLIIIIGGGVPKNFAQDTVICAEVLGKQVDMHKYAVQSTVADVSDEAFSSSTLKEASSWGKVDTGHEQMVYAEASSVLPLIVSYIYHKRNWDARRRREFTKIFE